MNQEPVPQVYVVDDDVSVREALSSLIRSAGLSVRTFASASELLGRLEQEQPGCLVLDIQLPISVDLSSNSAWQRTTFKFRSSFSLGMVTFPCQSERLR